MTPLAQRLMRDFCKNGKLFPSKESDLNALFVNALSQAKCFDVTEVSELAYDLMEKKSIQCDASEMAAVVHPELGVINGYKITDLDESFLPFDFVWLEERVPGIKSAEWINGFLLFKLNGRTAVFIAGGELNLFIVSFFCFIHLKDDVAPGEFSEVVAVSCEPPAKVEGDSLLNLGTLLLKIHGHLAIINSPKVINRSEHRSSYSLETKLKRSNIIPAGSGLRPWTKIILDVSPPPERSGVQSGQRLTGAKALHFCRSFLRIRNGKLERVRSHWRGDASLGVVRSDYKVRT